MEESEDKIPPDNIDVAAKDITELNVAPVLPRADQINIGVVNRSVTTEQKAIFVQPVGGLKKFDSGNENDIITEIPRSC